MRLSNPWCWVGAEAPCFDRWLPQSGAPMWASLDGPVFADTLFPGKNAPTSSLSEMPPSRLSTPHHLRFLAAHSHLSHVFGGDWFAKGAESFARFFGTPFFLMAQSAIVIFWIYLNVANYTTFDRYPFILLNLAFSLQAAYAAPLISFEMHKEQQLALQQTRQLLSLLDQNNEMTLVVRQLSERIESLTSEIHSKVVL